MLYLSWRRLLPAAWLALPCVLSAAPPDPLDASAPVAAVRYESAFKAYRGHADAALRDWKATNDTVGRIGGWRAYAREAHAESPRPAPPADAASQPAAKDVHRHHGGTP